MKTALKWLATTAAVALASAGASAQTAEDDARLFGSRPLVLDISLSPDGKKVAFVTPAGGPNELVKIVDLASGEIKPLMVMKQQDAEMNSCDWANDGQLVCNVSYVVADGSQLISFDRTFAIDVATGKFTSMSEEAGMDALAIMQDGGTVIALDPQGETNRIVMTRQWVAERTTGTRMNSTKEGLGVDLVDLANGKRTAVEQPDAQAERYVADETGRVRLKVRHLTDSTGRLTGKRTFMYRPLDNNGWKPLSRVDEAGDTADNFYPVAVDGAANVAYGFQDLNGFDAIYKLALAEGAKPELVLSRDDVDVDSLIRVGRGRRVVGASYATEKRQVAYFDKELQALSNALGKALPTKPLISFVDASADGNKLLIIASSDTDPGMVYIYDKPTKRLEEVFPMRVGLEGRAMGAMTPVTFPAADGTAIPGYLTLPPSGDGKNLPAIVMPHGGPSARDEWGFDWLVQYFVSRGYAVLQPNYRGSSGYGSAWFGRNGFKAWRTAVGDVNDAGRWLVSQGIADPGKLSIVGWSYGGYAALQSQTLDPALYKAVVAIAPVTDLALLARESEGFTNSALVKRFIGTGPHVEEGSPARFAGGFAAPVYLAHGDRDENVGINQSRMMAKRLKDAGKKVQMTEFPGLAHSLDDSASRAKMLSEIDAFLKASLGT